jgi:integrase
MFYWRTTLNKKAHREPIGYYDSSAPPKSLQPTPKGYSIAAATRSAETLAQAHFNHREQGGHLALVEAEAETKRAALAAVQLAEQKKQDAARYTLNSLLNHYCDHLETLGRTSHKKVRGLFKLHVLEAWPDAAGSPANQITGEQAADMMRRIVEAGHGRTSNKFRSYARAAYQMAKSARSKASVPVHFKGYKITGNPFDETEPDATFNKADKSPLSADEMRAYWRLIENAPGFSGALLRLHLLTGGQRIEQLVKLLTEHVTGESISIWDGKGRPGPGARLHTVPLTPPAAAALAECKSAGLYALSLGNGDAHISSTTFSVYARTAAATIPGFKAKRIRSGVETMLAAAGVSGDTRGRLQSHGVSGVQARHYDAYDYSKEKRGALETLHSELNKPPRLKAA